MAGHFSGHKFSVPFTVPSTFTTGDAKVTYQMPCSAKLEDCRGYIGTLGGSGGYTYVQIRNSTDSVNMLNSNGLAIAYGDADQFASATLATTASSLTVDSGDTICLDVDSCCSGAAEKDLTVWTLWTGM